MLADTYPKPAKWIANATQHVRGRWTSPDATGAVTGVAGEGKWLKQSDFTGNITRTIYDESTTTPSIAISTTTVTVASSIQDVPVTSTADWTEDTVGWNFKDTIASSIMTVRDHRYRVVYTGIVTGDSTATVLDEFVGVSE